MWFNSKDRVMRIPIYTHATGLLAQTPLDVEKGHLQRGSGGCGTAKEKSFLLSDANGQQGRGPHAASTRPP